MAEVNYTVKEIIELQFNALRGDLSEIKNTLKDQNVQTEKRFTRIEHELDDIRQEQKAQAIVQAKYNTIWGIGATIGASLFAYLTNRLLS